MQVASTGRRFSERACAKACQDLTTATTTHLWNRASARYELEMTEYNSSREAWREITEYIEYYNFRRKHSSLDYLTLIQFESSQ